MVCRWFGARWFFGIPRIPENEMGLVHFWASRLFESQFKPRSQKNPKKKQSVVDELDRKKQYDDLGKSTVTPLTHGCFEWYLYGCFRKQWYPQIIQFNRVFHYKPSILGYSYFWKHPYTLSAKFKSFNFPGPPPGISCSDGKSSEKPGQASVKERQEALQQTGWIFTQIQDIK